MIDFRLGDTVCMKREPTLPVGRVIAIVKKSGCYLNGHFFGAGTIIVRRRQGGYIALHSSWVQRMVWTRPINAGGIYASPQ